MENYIQANDYKLWMLIKNSPLIPKKATEDGKIIPKKPEEFNAEDFRMMEKNEKAKRLLYFGLGPNEYTASPSASQPKKFGILSMLLMKVDGGPSN